MTRGAAAVLGASDLAAIAKGRNGEAAQVLLSLELPAGESQECPIGRPAFVEFPGVGIIDVVRARLRL